MLYVISRRNISFNNVKDAPRPILKLKRTFFLGYIPLRMRYFSQGQRQGNSGYLAVDKTEALIDEQIKIEVHGVRPSSKVTVRATCMTECKNNTLFQSFAHYEATSDGIINIRELPSLGGTYTGIQPMGLFWSKAPLKNSSTTNWRISVNDLSKPLITTLELYNGFLDFDKGSYSQLSDFCLGVKPLHAIIVKRSYLASNVAQEIVKYGRLRGLLFYPKAPGKFKGVIDMFGATSGLLPSRAALLASHGFTTFSLPYFGFDDLPTTVKSLEMEYFNEAVDWFIRHPKVEDNGIGVIGVSLGAQMALLLATRKQNEVKAVVGINGGDLLALNPIYEDGIPLPFQRGILEERMRNKYGDTCYGIVRASEENFKALIPIEEMKSKLLLVVGGDDACVDSSFYSKRIMERMKKCGKEDQCQRIVYPKTGHLIEPPCMPNFPFLYDTAFGQYIALGGDALYHAKAQEDSWQKIINFFKNCI